MPLLTDNQKRRLGAYITSRDGVIIPGTHAGDLHAAACWSWALTGRFLSLAHANSAGSIYDAIIGNDLVVDEQNPDAATFDLATHINDVDAQFPGCDAEFVILRANIAACRAADAAARGTDVALEAALEAARVVAYAADPQPAANAAAAVKTAWAARIKTAMEAVPAVIAARATARAAWAAAAGVATVEKTRFKQAMMGICARMNGLVPAGPGDAHTYTLHMRTSRWFAWDHWGIGVRVPPGNVLNYIQTVPNFTIRHATDVMWDEHMPLASIGLTGLLQTHINVIDTIPRAPAAEAKCRQPYCNRTHAATAWYRCGTCGTLWCDLHGMLLPRAGAGRNCTQCGGAIAEAN
ncbi:hypothetical protein [Andreprevotia chitinilytica]|uniref:hypothetical protein n=1 Tax=Andreprevotia chitinilytica TaxID=396808 RepID=UPI000554246D|nr:hypothetical protein [Andreprevotia chitinilytica]